MATLEAPNLGMHETVLQLEIKYNFLPENNKNYLKLNHATANIEAFQ